MKKFILINSIFMLTILSMLGVSASKRDSLVIAFDDVTTLNFNEKTAKYNIESIKKICTYDFCDYVRGQSKMESILIFTENYLKNVDREVAASLRVKGIKITSLELK